MKKKPDSKDVYTLADLQDWQETVGEIKPPIRLGVLGDLVAHSLSPEMQNAALRECKIDAQYARFHIRPNELAEALDLISRLDFVGLNLTVPHKIAALEFVDETDEEAKKIGAVNTIAVAEGKLASGVFGRSARFAGDASRRRWRRPRHCHAMRAGKL
jgi:Shikimate dehydrogenase substrate binding domain